MSSGRLAQLEALFHACLDLPEAVRAAYLAEQCQDDDAMRREVMDLLARDAADSTSVATDLPTQLGPYRLLEKLGEGGFGEVFAAEQSGPIERRVAIKVLKAGLDTRAVLARFDGERQALALMDHPGIARVLDAGATPSGRPFFVMELVEGKSITDFVEAARTTTRERLLLFIEVCRAVEHAHQKGVIHRDLKPSNVLVTIAEGRPAPRIIDFGIAKATRSGPRDASLVTRAGEFLGTPEYASPEQAESGGVDLDTRSDVYSLGVLLYRLLTGRLPFPSTQLRAGSLDELRRTLREQEAPRPSRVVDDPRLARELRGELDWILLRALEKERDRRYSSAGAFADDLERHLAHQAVAAGPPTTWYRFRKFVRRRRPLVVSVAAVLVALLAGIVGTTTQAIRARRAERDALKQARVATEVSGFLTRMLESGNPEVNPRGDRVTVRQVVDQASREIDQARFEDATVEAGVRAAMGATYSGLALYGPAIAQLDRAVDAARAAHGPHAETTCAIELSLAEALEKGGEAARADSLLREIGRRLDQGDDALRARYYATLGDHLGNAGRWAEADSLVSLSARLRANGDRGLLARTLTDLADIRRARGAIAPAESLGRQALALTRAEHPGDHHEVAMAAARLAATLEDAGKLPEAESLLRETVAIHRRVLGPEHPVAAISTGNLGLCVDRAGRHAEAESLYQAALAVARPALGEEDREVLALEDNLAVAQQAQGKYGEALTLRLRVLDAQRRTLGQKHPLVASTLNNLGALYRLMQRYSEAEPVFREAIEIFAASFGREHPNVAIGLNNLAKTLLDEGRCAEAEPVAREAHELAERLFPEGHVNRAVLSATYGRALACVGKREEAERRLTAARAVLQAALGAEHPRVKEVDEQLEKLRGR
ncbi:MAG: serine/threonine-protein kinase [Candidatus Eisenbacteria bacterium]